VIVCVPGTSSHLHCSPNEHVLNMSLKMLSRVVASAFVGVLLYLLIIWLVDKVSLAAPPESPLRAALDGLLVTMFPVTFGVMYFLLFSVLAFVVLGRYLNRAF
jgi:hypothetical protein